MRALAFCLLFVITNNCLSAPVPTDLKPKQSLVEQLATQVRVRLEIGLSDLQVSGRGIKVQGSTREYLSVAIPQTESIRASSIEIAGKPVWKVEKTKGASTRTEIVTSPLLTIEGTQLVSFSSSGSKALPNKIFLSLKAGRIDLIGVLPLESYLVGVLASEMPLRWPIESLKAQAIAARSYTLAVMAERKSQTYHLESSIRDQVFRHVAEGVDHDPLIERAFEAVKATDGMVLLGPKKKVLKAYYHADCGGTTSSAKTVWGYGDSTPGAVDQGCPTNPRATWSLQLSQKAISEKVARIINPMPEAQSEQLLVADIEPHRQSPGMRADSVVIKFKNGLQKIVLADSFRAMLGYAQIKSTQFEVSKTGAPRQPAFVISGKGFGHGVGLCQWGSRVLATNKKSHIEILKHYYPQAEIY